MRKIKPLIQPEIVKPLKERQEDAKKKNEKTKKINKEHKKGVNTNK